MRELEWLLKICKNNEEVGAFQCGTYAVWIDNKFELKKYIFNFFRTSGDNYRQGIYERALKNIGLDFPCWVAQDNLEYGIEYISLSKRVGNLQEVIKSFKEKEEKVEKDNDRG